MLNCSSPAARWVERTLQARQARPGHPKAVVLEPSPTGEARSRHTKAVVPGLVPGTQCPSRLKALPIRDGAFAAGRTEEGRGGKEVVSTCKSLWSPAN